MMAMGERYPLGEFLAGLPELEFTSCIAFILANLEHGDDHEFDFIGGGAGLARLAVAPAASYFCIRRRAGVHWSNSGRLSDAASKECEQATDQGESRCACGLHFLSERTF